MTHLNIEVGLLSGGEAIVYRWTIDAKNKMIQESLLNIDGTWDKFEGEIHGLNKLKVSGHGK